MEPAPILRGIDSYLRRKARTEITEDFWIGSFFPRLRPREICTEDLKAPKGMDLMYRS